MTGIVVDIAPNGNPISGEVVIKVATKNPVNELDAQINMFLELVKFERRPIISSL